MRVQYLIEYLNHVDVVRLFIFYPGQDEVMQPYSRWKVDMGGPTKNPGSRVLKVTFQDEKYRLTYAIALPLPDGLDLVRVLMLAI